MPTYQFQTVPLNVDFDLNAAPWREIEAGNVEEVIQKALETVKLSDLPCSVRVIKPGARRWPNGKPFEVHSYQVALATRTNNAK